MNQALHELVTAWLPLKGENYIIGQQTTRGLLKALPATAASHTRQHRQTYQVVRQERNGRSRSSSWYNCFVDLREMFFTMATDKFFPQFSCGARPTQPNLN